MRAYLLAGLLLMTAFTGCIVDAEGTTSMDAGNETTSTRTVCSFAFATASTESSINPVSDTELSRELSGDSLVAGFAYEAEGTGSLTVTLDRADEEIWRSGHTTELGESDTFAQDERLENLSAGEYILTASSSSGSFDVSMNLSLASGNC